MRDSGSYSNKDVVDESGGENGACIGSKHFDAMDDTKADGHLNKVAPYDEVEEQGSDMSPKLWENATAEETKVTHTIPSTLSLCYESYHSPHLYAHYFDFQG